MKVIIHNWGHVPTRQRERQFTAEDVQFVYENPQTTWDSAQNKSKTFRGTLPDGRVLQIVVLMPPRPDGSVILKTAYFIESEESNEH